MQCFASFHLANFARMKGRTHFERRGNGRLTVRWWPTDASLSNPARWAGSYSMSPASICASRNASRRAMRFCSSPSRSSGIIPAQSAWSNFFRSPGVRLARAGSPDVRGGRWRGGGRTGGDDFVQRADDVRGDLKPSAVVLDVAFGVSACADEVRVDHANITADRSRCSRFAVLRRRRCRGGDPLPRSASPIGR